MKIRLLIMVAVAAAASYLSFILKLSAIQSLVLPIFLLSISGIVLFWDLKLNFAFLGSGLLLLVNAVNLENFIKFASLDVILFLIGMMILVGIMKDAGLFDWVLQRILSTTNLNAVKLVVIIMLTSAFSSALMGEVTSIIIMATIIFNLCDFIDIESAPLLIASIIATNIGSAMTVLGNPIGILIAARAKLSFFDFIVFSAPIALIVLAVSILFVLLIYRKYLSKINTRLREITANDFFIKLIDIRIDRKTVIGIIIFVSTIILIAFHHQLEKFFGVEKNSLLMILPVFSSGIAMFYRSDRSGYYVEREIEWGSLLFFMFLFIQAGVFHASGVAAAISEKVLMVTGHSNVILVFEILFSSAILSSLLDNTVVVASYIPILMNLKTGMLNSNPIWWALLFGACFGGNITVIGSTANIVAMNLYGKRYNKNIGFLQWFKVGLIIGLLTMLVSFLLMLVYPVYNFQ